MRTDWSSTQLIGEMEIPTAGGTFHPVPQAEGTMLWERDDALSVAADICPAPTGRVLKITVGHPDHPPTADEVQQVIHAFFAEGTATKVTGRFFVEGRAMRPFHAVSITEVPQDAS